MRRNGLMKKVDPKAYEIIPRTLLQHERLSLQAIGLLCNLQSYPEDWKLYKSELYKRFPKNKETSVRNAFNELVEEKYIVEIKERDGKRWVYTYYFRTEPFTEEEIREIYSMHGLEISDSDSQEENNDDNNENLGTRFPSPQQKKEENLETCFSSPQNEVPKMKTSKPRSNRIHNKEITQKENTQAHNKHLSIITEEKINEVDLPSSI